MTKLSDNELRQRFQYDPETGLISREGRVVGHRNKSLGYILVATGHTGKVYGHRLAFFLQTGRWPALVDHANGNGFDNRWANLREATKRTNAYNSHRRCDNTSGYKGVSWSRQRGAWRVCLQLPSGRQKHVGLYTSAEAAYAAWLSAAADLHGEYFHVG